ncbi:ATP-binding protein [Novosphingobium sp. ZN18A2]|uniref:sensor histidine kinase n=1 Tax=Novosphingobium sp. ZN18A2 TaxID=3079861 RepID=UPI0030CA64C0
MTQKHRSRLDEAISDRSANARDAECRVGVLDLHSASAAHLEKMYDRISDLAKIGVWECDLATDRLTWTDTVYDLFEIPRGKTIDRDEVLSLYDSASRGEMERRRSAAIKSGTGFTQDVLIRGASGNEKWIRITAKIEHDVGKPVRIFGTKQDVTAEKAMQEQVRSLQNRLIYASRSSAMDTMASTLAHEVNQPLATASNYIEAARRIGAHEGVSQALTDCLEAALKSTLHAGEIIRRTRNMPVRLLAKRTNLEIEQLVNEAVALSFTGSTNLSITFDIVSVAPVIADRLQIQQVLINLIRNACEAADGKPCNVTVRSLAGKTHLELCVSDNGPGIPQDVLPDVFETFFTTRRDGSGIGLAIARTIVEAHGGTIKAANLNEGGAILSFTVPLAYPG